MVKGGSQVQICFVDAVDDLLVDSADVLSDQVWLEHDLRGSDENISDSNGAAVRQLVLFKLLLARFELRHFLFEIHGKITNLLFDVSCDFLLRR